MEHQELPAQERSFILSSGREVIIVHPLLVKKLWPKVGPLLDKAVKRANGNLYLEDLLNDILAERAALWVVFNDREIEGAFTTQVSLYHRRRVCAVPFVGGRNLRYWLEAYELIKDWARARNCDAVEGYARKGWFRMLPKMKPIYTVTREDL